MKTCKFAVALTVFFLAVIGGLSGAQACLNHPVGPIHVDPIHMDAVSFYIYDLDKDNQATINPLTWSRRSCDVNAASLEYTIDGSIWNDFSGPVDVEFGGADSLQISLRLNSTDQDIYSGKVFFGRPWKTSDSDLYQNLFVWWDDQMVDCCSCKNKFCPTIISSPGADRLGQHAPIPASALLLVSGLAGLVGFRGRIKNR